MSAYIGYSPGITLDTTNQLSDQIIPIVDGIKTYTLSFAPSSNNLIFVSVNGTFYIPSQDFYIIGDKITFTNLLFPSSGTIYIFYLGTNYFRLNTVSDNSIQRQHLASDLKLFEIATFTGDGIEKNFQLSFSPGSSYSTLIFINSVLKKPSSDYFIVDNLISFAVAPANNSEIVVRNLGFKSSEVSVQIPSGFIIEEKLADSSISENKLKDESVSSNKIKNKSVTFEKVDDEFVKDFMFYELISSSTSLNSVKSRKLLVDTSSSAIQITLPSSPSYGQVIEILDVKDAFDEYPCSILRNGNTINGSSSNISFYKKGVHCILIFVGSSNWKLAYYNEGQSFLGVQYSISAAMESYFSQDGYFVSYLDKVCSFPFVFSISPSSSSLSSGQTLTISIQATSVGFSGSGTLPKLVILLSDNVTTKNVVLNTSSSTSNQLNFDYVVDAISTGITIQSFSTGSRIVTINGKTLTSINSKSLSVNFI